MIESVIQPLKNRALIYNGPEFFSTRILEQRELHIFYMLPI